MHNESADALAHAITRAGNDGGARAALAHGLEDGGPDDADSCELARRFAHLIEGVSAGDAIGEALAVGMMAGQEVGERAGRAQARAGLRVA